MFKSKMQKNNEYISTNIRLPQALYFGLKLEAAGRRMSLSAVVRERLRAALAAEGEAVKDDESVPVVAELPPALYTPLLLRARREGKSVHDLVGEILEAHLDDSEEQG